jgi:uncharacterized protein
MIISPCISICKTDPETGFCFGCARTLEEKKLWKDVKTADDWKNNNILDLKKRLFGKQLEYFNESYQHKIDYGISLYKKNNLK